MVYQRSRQLGTNRQMGGLPICTNLRCFGEIIFDLTPYYGTDLILGGEV